MTGLPGWPANRTSCCVSTVFADLPLRDRFAAATAAGYQAAESWWPFSGPDPTDAQIEVFARTVSASGLPLVSLNFYTGSRRRGEHGILYAPDRTGEFTAALRVCADLALQVRCPRINVLFGNVDGAQPTRAQHRTALARLEKLSAALQPSGATIMLEPLNATDSPRYALHSVADVREIIDEFRTTYDGVARLCFDVYHAFHENPRVADLVAGNIDIIEHVQISDSPGRREPGTGVIDVRSVVSELVRLDYAGYVGLEYFHRTAQTPAGSRLPKRWVTTNTARTVPE